MELLFVVLFLMLCSITAEGNSGRIPEYFIFNHSVKYRKHGGVSQNSRQKEFSVLNQFP